ncbi:D-alanyl-lipoteichoic acid biosynthesis protein DltD [Lactobacillus sp. UCMA15818]|uniref:D-alanyl-lipoteichoic acid biosynthesis protein DltD n=1 Tax=Lactobacillaceae TaxID=33958 RepID=UPI0025B23736|nr:D-alanyl-lipoteichoic acid biosynthesis protein DltD [Lactobacillus sp. UCMA15818]MDN2452895.1 D-alanyl-lipoteichoic acid biosynthesis protein DltD [Lactobacillus sp. UCMA15818]
MIIFKRLFLIFGPVVCAAIIVLGFLFSPFRPDKISQSTIQKAALSQSPQVFKGMAVKRAAFKENYVPFFGSSELSRIDALHPSVLAQKYHRSYRPFLLGTAGTQSITQFWQMQGFGNELNNKKAVFIISPQWFVKGGIDPAAFNYFYPRPEIVNWLLKAKPTTENRYAAERLLALNPKDSTDEIDDSVLRIAAGQRLTSFQKTYLHSVKNELDHEDQLFSTISLNNREALIKKREKELPAVYNEAKLDKIGYELGKANTTNNSLRIDNNFWNHKLKPVYKKLAGEQRNFSYVKSVEYSDFQLVLNEFAKHHINVLFIIPPVNEKWAKYTGLSMSMIQTFNNKITYQLNSQGFTHIANLSKEGKKPYFMQDTIHLGWRGWLAVDQYVNPFLTKKQAKPQYKMDNYFYTKKWQNLDY